jgi:hypothetical protein
LSCPLGWVDRGDLKTRALLLGFVERLGAGAPAGDRERVDDVGQPVRRQRQWKKPLAGKPQCVPKAVRGGIYSLCQRSARSLG